MKNILIFSLKGPTSLWSCGQIINNLRKQHPQAQVHIVCWEDQQHHAINLKPDQLCAIPKSKISKIKSSSNIPDIHAFKIMTDCGKFLRSRNWDLAVNWSNDEISSMLITYAQPKKFVGIKYQNNKTIAPSSPWAIYLNEIASDQSSVHRNDIFEKMTNVECCNQDQFFIADQVNAQTAAQKFTQLKKVILQINPDCNLVGITIPDHLSNTAITLDTYKNLINFLLQDNKYFPILLINNVSSAKEIVNELNMMFDNRLLTISGSPSNLISVFEHIDALVNYNHPLKYIGQDQNLPTIDIYSDFSQAIREHITNNNSIVITATENLRGIDIYQALKHMLQNVGIQNTLSKSCDLFRVKEDALGQLLIPLSQLKSSAPYLNYRYERIITHFLIEGMNIKEINSHLDNLSQVAGPELDKWLLSEIKEMKPLLELVFQGLHTIKNIKNKFNQVEDLIDTMGKLLNLCQLQSPIRIPLIFFRYHLETSEANKHTHGLRHIEQALLQLKRELQKLMIAYRYLSKQEIHHNRELQNQ